MKLYFLTIILILISLNAYARSGVEYVIEKDLKESATIDCSKFSYDPQCRSYASSDSELEYANGLEEYAVNVDMKIQSLKNSIMKEIGLPEGKSYIIILFALAVLFELARGIASYQPSWLPFAIRSVVVLIFLDSFSEIFNSVEAFVFGISESIMPRHPFQIFMDEMIQAFMYGTNFDGYLLDSPLAFANGVLVTIVSGVSLLVFLVGYYTIFFLQACILICLYYFGPIVVALSIIREIDFSEAYITSVLQVLSWAIITSIILRVMTFTVEINFRSTHSVTDTIILSVMTLCYGFSIFSIPLIAQLVFSGRSWGSLTGAAMHSARNIIRVASLPIRNKLRNAKDGVKSLALVAAAGTYASVKGVVNNKTRIPSLLNSQSSVTAKGKRINKHEYY